jgi:hypothetical protein
MKPYPTPENPATSYVERWVLCMLLCGTIVILCAGCASEGVGKGAAAQSSGIAAVVAGGAATVTTAGWAIVLGFLAGLARLMFADSTSTAPPGAAPSFSFPWGTVALIVLGVLVLRGRAHIIRGLQGKQPWGDVLLRVFSWRTDKVSRPIKSPAKA